VALIAETNLNDIAIGTASEVGHLGPLAQSNAQVALSAEHDPTRPGIVGANKTLAALDANNPDRKREVVTMDVRMGEDVSGPLVIAPVIATGNAVKT